MSKKSSKPRKPDLQIGDIVRWKISGTLLWVTDIHIDKKNEFYYSVEELKFGLKKGFRSKESSGGYVYLTEVTIISQI